MRLPRKQQTGRNKFTLINGGNQAGGGERSLLGLSHQQRENSGHPPDQQHPAG